MHQQHPIRRLDLAHHIVVHTLVSETDAQAVENNCWEVLKTVYDPEIPVNSEDWGFLRL